MLTRYINLFAYAILSILLIEIAINTQFFMELIQNHVDFINMLSVKVRTLYVFLMGIGLFSLLLKLKIISVKRLLKPSRIYPPLYWATYIPLLYILFSIDRGFIYYLFTSDVGLLILALFTANICSMGCEKYKQKKIDEDASSEQSSDWLKSGNSIIKLSELKFGRELYVERIKTRLVDVNYESHIALCGKYGSGKTCIVDCVAKSLEDCGWGVIKIDSWGRNIDSANGQILNSILNKASEFVDISSLRPLPSNYQNALKAKGGWFSAINSLISNYEGDYLHQLAELDKVFLKINKKVLIVLEDIDRNDSADLYCAEVGALLDKLRQFKSFRFIVAVGYNDKVADIISRVCDYREDLSNENYLYVINSELAKWIQRATEQKCFLPQKYNSNFSFQSSISSCFNPVAKDVHIEINTLIATPRTCKQVLRRVDEIWMKGKLIGEIDLVNLIVLQIIREVAPSLFSLIIIFENSLLNGVSDVAKNQDRIDKEVKKLQGIFQECMNGYDNPVALSSCLGFLYSSWPSFNRIGSGIRTGGQSLESISNSVRYLDRFIRESLSCNELSDQKVIRLMVDYKSKAQSKTKERHPLIEKVTFNLDYLGGFLEFVSQYWSKKDGGSNDVVFKRFVIHVMGVVTDQYTAGFIYSDSKPLFDNESKNWYALIVLIDWLVQINEFRNDKWLTKIAIKNLVNTDLNLLIKFLNILGELKYFEFQPEIINMLNQSLRLEGNALMLDSQSHPRDICKLCKLLSWQRDSHAWTNKFNIEQWEPTIKIIIDRALSDSVKREKLLVIVMMFFIKSENNDRNTPLINIDLMRTLAVSLVKKIKSVTNQSDRDKLMNSFEYIIPIEIDTWIREINN